MNSDSLSKKLSKVYFLSFEEAFYKRRFSGIDLLDSSLGV